MMMLASIWVEFARKLDFDRDSERLRLAAEEVAPTPADRGGPSVRHD
jgi:hypothetical protein